MKAKISNGMLQELKKIGKGIGKQWQSLGNFSIVKVRSQFCFIGNL